jgi:hypothetical protein
MGHEEVMYASINWKHYSKTFKKLLIGQLIQIFKYIDDLLHTIQQLQSLITRFMVNALPAIIFGREDTNHVHTCTVEACCAARAPTQLLFQQQLLCIHTPDIMNKLICDIMDNWLEQRPVTL